MASKLRQKTRGKRGGSGGSRRGGKASAKRQASSRRANKRQAANRARDQQISDRNIDRARSGGNRQRADIRTGGESTGRERGIAAANTYNRDKKEKSLQQSVGSLDRRVEKALADGNTALAKDLRSRQKNFVKDLGYQRALNTPGGIMQGNVRTSDGRRPLTSAGFDVFQETMDQDFLDPTRKLQNTGGDAYGKMYPISGAIQKGLPTINAIKSFLGAEDKDIPYNLEDMPGIRYPLDQEPFFGGRSKIGYDDSDRPIPKLEIPYPLPKPTLPGKDEVTDKDRQAAIDRGIDPNFIFSLPDDPRTELIESDLNTGSALQLAEAANTQNTLSDLVRPEFTPPNVFALPEPVKEKLNKDAKENVKTYEIETYGKEITSDDLAKAGVNEAYYNMNFDTPIIQKQLFQSGVIEEKDVQAPIVNNVNIEPRGNLLNQIASVPIDFFGLMGGNMIPGYTSMADQVRNFDPIPTKQYTGQEFVDEMSEKNAQAIAAINEAQDLNIDQKKSLTDFVNDGGVNLNPQYFNGVQTNDPYNFNSSSGFDNLGFDDYVQQGLNRLR